SMFVAADQLLKGAALNAVQIAELLPQRVMAYVRCAVRKDTQATCPPLSSRIHGGHAALCPSYDGRPQSGQRRHDIRFSKIGSFEEERLRTHFGQSIDRTIDDVELRRMSSTPCQTSETLRTQL
ncbi:hypothetical protein ISU75_19360, partial [Leptospira borgpetersenii serovar Hardjo-bovis]|nr:hypothetical protein [Leptospira borgpetersenii serovar Hardjo-bovis]